MTLLAKMFASPQNDMGKMVKVSCGECSKMLTFTNLKRHMKTVHDRDIGKRWTCQNCGKASQSEKRLIQHQKLHRSGACDDRDDPKIFSCSDCDYRTIVERYLVDHKKIQHTISGNGQFICVDGKCSAKASILKNLRQLDMHRTCHKKSSVMHVENNLAPKEILSVTRK